MLSPERELEDLRAKWQPISLALQYLEQEKQNFDGFRENLRVFLSTRALPTTYQGVLTEMATLRLAINQAQNQNAMKYVAAAQASTFDFKPSHFSTIQSDIVNAEMNRQLETLETMLLDYFLQLLPPTERALLTKRLENTSIFSI